jgi:hypothetical protein
MPVFSIDYQYTWGLLQSIFAYKPGLVFTHTQLILRPPIHLFALFTFSTL